MNLESIDSIHLAWKQVFHAFKKQSRAVMQEMNMTKVDANILLVLRGEKVMTKQEVASELSFESNSLTRSLDRLIAQEIVLRVCDPEDRRRVQLSLTQQGEQFASAYIQHMRPFWQKALQGLDEQEMEHLEQSLSKITENI